MNTPVEKKDNKDVVLIPPKTDLRQKVVVTGSGNSAYRQAIKAAEQAIEKLSVEFDDWLNLEVDKLEEVINTIKSEGWNETNADSLFTVSHDIKGQASTLGYPIITEISDTLCHLLEKVPDNAHISIKVIETFATSIRLILTQCEQNEENAKANAISSGLRQMAMKIIKSEMQKAGAQTEETNKAE